MNRRSVLWLALAMALPMLGAGCAHRAERGEAAPLGAGMHAGRAGPAGHAHHAEGEGRAGHRGHRGHHHHAHDGAGAAPESRWPADAALSRGMGRVRAVADSLVHASHGHLDADGIRALSAELKSAVETMFLECKLDPAPDAALHPLLARVLGASQALSDGEFDAGALAELRAVLARYGELFVEDAISADQTDSA